MLIQLNLSFDVANVFFQMFLYAALVSNLIDRLKWVPLTFYDTILNIIV